MKPGDLFRQATGPPRLLGWLIIVALLGSCDAEPPKDEPPPRPPGISHRI